jgi:DNA-binding NtrC family response regulator
MAQETILILDNERYVQWILKTLLESEGYSIITADTIEITLDHFAKKGVSGLIAEYYIDQFCTLEAIRDLKTTFPEVYVMMLTNHDVNGGEYKEIINAGVDDFFKKPFSTEKILLHLKKGLRQREILIQKSRLEQELNRMGNGRKIEKNPSAEKIHRTITHLFNRT